MLTIPPIDLAGINEGSAQNSTVNLYQFGQPKDLVTYTSNTTSRFTRVRFDPFGARFGASDTKGDLHLWRFDASAQALAPALRWECHSVTNDFLFWDSSSLIATAGTSTNHTNVRLWDALLPTHKARIKSFSIAEGGAYSLIYSARHQRLFAGGKKGDIYVIDTRQRVVVDNFHAHEQTVKSLAIDDENDCLISGSTGGDVKVINECRQKICAGLLTLSIFVGLELGHLQGDGIMDFGPQLARSPSSRKIAPCCIAVGKPHPAPSLILPKHVGGPSDQPTAFCEYWGLHGGRSCWCIIRSQRTWWLRSWQWPSW
ncbi:WD40-repeat-containing domain protein [Phlyctochytrium arcticum]|nr:WD40-repeat-containing domain protein [Phlyctochytrium arcticum]